MSYCLDRSSTQEASLWPIPNHPRRAFDLTQRLTMAVTEVQGHLHMDRIMVYQFQADGRGTVVAEAIKGDRLPSLLDQTFPADEMPTYLRKLYVVTRQRTIVDLITNRMGISVPDDTEESTQAGHSNILDRPVDSYHREHLRALGVKSAVVVPIILESEPAADDDRSLSLQLTSQLWGLLICHHTESHTMTAAELEWMQATVDQMTIAIRYSR